MKAVSKFFKSLANRREFQVGTVYLGSAWLLLDLAVVLEETLKLPDGFDRLVLYALAAGFPLALLVGWLLERHEDEEEDTEKEVVPTHVHAHENPSVVIMPFRARAKDEIESLTAEGLTDEITTMLTSVLGLKVLPRQAVGRSLADDADPLAMARSFKADYMVSGSVRRDDIRLRVLCELTDLSDNNQIWSQKYDRTIEDLFAIQDDVAHGVVGTLGGMIAKIEGFRAARQPPEKLKAWELTRRAHEVPFDWRPEKMAQAVADCRRAIEIDPGYAHAHAYLGINLSWQNAQGWTHDPVLGREEALAEAQKALDITSEDAEVISAVGEIYRLNTEPERAMRLYDNARARNPDIFAAWPFALVMMGWTYAQLGQEEKGLEYVTKFENKFPSNDLGRLWTRVVRGYIELCRRNYEAVVELHENPPSEYNGMCRIVALMHLGRRAEADTDFDRLQLANPDISVAHYIEHFKKFHANPEVGEELSRALQHFSLRLDRRKGSADTPTPAM